MKRLLCLMIIIALLMPVAYSQERAPFEDAFEKGETIALTLCLKKAGSAMEKVEEALQADGMMQDSEEYKRELERIEELFSDAESLGVRLIFRKTQTGVYIKAAPLSSDSPFDFPAFEIETDGDSVYFKGDFSKGQVFCLDRRDAGALTEAYLPVFRQILGESDAEGEIDEAVDQLLYADFEKLLESAKNVKPEADFPSTMRLLSKLDSEENVSVYKYGDGGQRKRYALSRDQMKEILYSLEKEANSLLQMLPFSLTAFFPLGQLQFASKALDYIPEQFTVDVAQNAEGKVSLIEIESNFLGEIGVVVRLKPLIDREARLNVHVSHFLDLDIRLNVPLEQRQEKAEKKSSGDADWLSAVSDKYASNKKRNRKP